MAMRRLRYVSKGRRKIVSIADILDRYREWAMVQARSLARARSRGRSLAKSKQPFALCRRQYAGDLQYGHANACFTGWATQPSSVLAPRSAATSSTQYSSNAASSLGRWRCSSFRGLQHLALTLHFALHWRFARTGVESASRHLRRRPP